MSTTEAQGLNLLTHVFNTFSARNFLNKTCPQHPGEYVTLICASCSNFNGEAYCDVCFTEHQCDQKREESLNSWISREREKLTQTVLQIQKQVQNSCNFKLSGFKFKAFGVQNKSVSEVNNMIVIRLSKQLQALKKEIDENCITPFTSHKIPQIMATFSNKLEEDMNALDSDLRSVINLQDNIKDMVKESTQQISSLTKKIESSCLYFYQSGVENIFEMLLDEIQSSPKSQQVRNSGKQMLSAEIYEKNIESLNKELAKSKQRQSELLEKNRNLHEKILNLAQKSQENENQYEIQRKQFQKLKLALLQEVETLKAKLQENKEEISEGKDREKEINRVRGEIRKLTQLVNEGAIQNTKKQRIIEEKMNQNKNLNDRLKNQMIKFDELEQKYLTISDQLDFVTNSSISLDETISRSMDDKLKLEEQISILKMKLESKDEDLMMKERRIEELEIEVSHHTHNVSLELEKESGSDEKQKSKISSSSSNLKKKKSLENIESEKNIEKKSQGKKIEIGSPKAQVAKFKDFLTSPKAGKTNEESKKLVKKNKNVAYRNKE